MAGDDTTIEREAAAGEVTAGEDAGFEASV
jgi:hypothetical protein